jgi:hypothetical protein
MRRTMLTLSLMTALAAGCKRPVAAVAEPAIAESVSGPRASGPRWVVIKCDGLSCATCAADLQRDLEHTAGVSQIETFAPQPYCRFYVDDGNLDVVRLLEDLKPSHSAALEGYAFVRGG